MKKYLLASFSVLVFVAFSGAFPIKTQSQTEPPLGTPPDGIKPVSQELTANWVSGDGMSNERYVFVGSVYYRFVWDSGYQSGEVGFVNVKNDRLTLYPKLVEVFDDVKRRSSWSGES
jgi:hypothetical protein